jgi:hypothetical protein
MVRAGDILTFLIPDSKWYINGNDFEGITFLNDITITKEEFEAVNLNTKPGKNNRMR